MNLHNFIQKMKKQLEEGMKAKIMNFRDKGLKLKEISEKLDIPISTVSYVIKKGIERNSNKRKAGSGRKESLEPQEKKAALNYQGKMKT